MPDKQGNYTPEDYGLDSAKFDFAEPTTSESAAPSVPTITTPLRATLPLQTQLQPDLTRQQVTSLPATRLMPVQASGNPAINAAVQSTAAPLINAAISAIPPAPAPTPGVGDGLTHGSSPWESDPGFVLLRDDFTSIAASGGSPTLSAGGIGELNWQIVNSGSIQGNAGGVAPNIGNFVFNNGGAVSQLTYIAAGGGGSWTNNTGFYNTAQALFDNPGWKATFIFKLDAGVLGGNGFDLTQKSIYVGLATPGISGTTESNTNSRPLGFIGVRFDTSTTSPSINDSFYTLEVVNNQYTTSGQARDNTQGVTLVTPIAPTQGTYQRLDISCTTAGMVTLSLNGGTPLTTAVPVNVITSTSNGVFNVVNGLFQLDWSGTGLGVWGAGSLVTVAGSSKPQYNGTLPVIEPNGDDILFFKMTGTSSGANNDPLTISGLPAYVPIFGMGNDDTASPTANVLSMWCDFYCYLWNPALASGATPDPTKSRYF